MSTVTNAPAGPRPGTEGGIRRLRGAPRRRSLPHLLLGLLLVTSCTAGAVVWSLNVGDRRPALALARSVAVGHTFEAADLREVNVAMDGDVDAIPASEARSVIGQTAGASLPAGALLPRGVLGSAPVSADDRAVAALALQPGQAPPDVHAGASVLVVLSADPNSSTNDSQPMSVWRGTVVAVSSATNEHLVVSVEFAEADARLVAAAPVGRLSVVLVSGGDR